MKRLFLPILFDGSNSKAKDYGIRLFLGMEPIDGYLTMEAAESAAKELSLKNPKAQVVILVSTKVIEPRKIEFAIKEFNSSGELIV